jgi:hypothetical protein
MFSQVSQSDIHVRNALGTRKVIRSKLAWNFEADVFVDYFFLFVGIMRACELLGAIKGNQDGPEGLIHMECLVQLLKAVKHLSMNATLHEVLQNANALEILISVLEQQSSGPHSTVIPTFLILLFLTIFQRRKFPTMSFKLATISVASTNRVRKRQRRLVLSHASSRLSRRALL